MPLPLDRTSCREGRTRKEILAATATVLAKSEERWTLDEIASFSGLRVLAWQEDVLFASRGYQLLSTKIGKDVNSINWQLVGDFRPPRWRHLTAHHRLTARLCRDGFHALAVLPSGTLLGAVPGAIVSLAPGETEFRISHRVLRGTRPLHLTLTPHGEIYWGEYFGNANREEVHIFVSSDEGKNWEIAHTFTSRSIRHVHNIVYDRWDDRLWILTGDDGSECQILRSTRDFRNIDVVLRGNQQARSAALVVAPDFVYFSSDTPFETNHIYRMDRRGNLTTLTDLPASSISGCCVNGAIFFSTMVEPSSCNDWRHVYLYGSRNGTEWNQLLRWKKDRWPSVFQYGNAFLADGKNTSGCLAMTTVAVDGHDFETSLWRVGSQSDSVQTSHVHY